MKIKLELLGLNEWRSGRRSTLDLCLEMDSSWSILCGAEIHVGLGPPQRTRGYGTYLEMFQGDKYYKITRLYNTTSVQLKYR